MNKTTAYIVAVFACSGIVVVYAVIVALLGWKIGGGAIPLLILFGILTATWKGILGLINEKNDDDKVKGLENIESKTDLL